MKEEKIEVRDLRNQEWLWTSKVLLFHPNVDEKMYKVYSGLAAYSNNQTQTAFPSIATLMQKLHMGRNTIIRALKKLEKYFFIAIKKEQGANNIYSLLELSDINKDDTSNEKLQDKPSVLNTEIKILEKKNNTPPYKNTTSFFKGVQDLRDKEDTPEATGVRIFLISLSQKYAQAPKGIIWSEIQKFERYWTEKNSTGTKERWQKQETFEIDRRLVTWFSKKDQFKKGSDIAIEDKGNKKII